MAADASAASSRTSPNRRPRRHRLQRSDGVVVLHGHALVWIARLRERVLENLRSSMVDLRGLCIGHISPFVRIIAGSEVGASSRFAERSHDFYWRTTAKAAV